MPYSRTFPPHGTHSAYVAHFVYGTEPCEACRKAHAEYTRLNRMGSEIRRVKDRKQRQAYTAAQVELRARHRAEFDAIYAEKRKEMCR